MSGSGIAFKLGGQFFKQQKIGNFAGQLNLFIRPQQADSTDFRRWREWSLRCKRGPPVLVGPALASFSAAADAALSAAGLATAALAVSAGTASALAAAFDAVLLAVVVGCSGLRRSGFGLGSFGFGAAGLVVFFAVLVFVAAASSSSAAAFRSAREGPLHGCEVCLVAWRCSSAAGFTAAATRSASITMDGLAAALA